MLIVLILLGILLGLGAPQFGAARDRLSVDHAATRIAAAHARARLTAVLEGRIALLTIRPDSLILTVIDGSDTLSRWAEPGPQGDGIGLTGPSHPLLFSPVGVSFGVSNATYVLVRGAAMKQVVISRWGRLRIQ